jgi:hypothetical protein
VSVPENVTVAVEMEFKHKLTGKIVLRDDPTDPERKPKPVRPVTGGSSE